MIRKSAWLLSAGFFALTTPAFAQTAVSNTDTDKQTAQPTDGATAEAAAVQDQAREQQPVDTGNIVITATRRNQALSDVPMAVSAVTAENLRNTGATDIRQLNQIAPSLQVFSTSSEGGAARANIRGIGTVGDNPGLESSVGVFIDGVYRSRTGAGLTELGPVDRIEVLRGPQGTLFGRNTSAGLISIITAKPRFTPEISGQLDVGNYDLRRIQGSVTGPFSDSLAARLDGVYMKRDGFLKDVISGRRVNDRDRWLLRGQMLYQPSDNLSVRIIGDYSKRNEECCAATYLPAQDVVATGGTVTTAPSTIANIERGLGGVIIDDTFARRVAITPGRDFDSRVRDYGLSGEVVYDFGGAELTSITAYRYNKYTRGQDPDFNNLDLWFRASDGGSFNRFKTFSQELRLQGNAFGNLLDWLVGGYYANEGIRVDDNITYGADYPRYANCLVANSFANALLANPLSAPLGATLVQPGAAGGGTCFNQATAPVIVGLLPAAQQPVFAAFARLAPFNAPTFTNSGFANLTNPALSLAGQGLDDTYRQKSNNWALFTHNIFSVTDRLKVTLGARYTHERKTLDAELRDNLTLCSIVAGSALASLQTLPCALPGVPGGSMSLDDSLTESKLSGTAVVSYKPVDRLLTYASYSRGYKGGGFNLDRSGLFRSSPPSTTPPPFPVSGNGAICATPTQVNCSGVVASGEDLKFRPEINNAIEAGFKFDGVGFDVNLAIFRQLFRDFQLNTFNGVNFVVENINSCKSDLNGQDADNSPFTGVCTGGLRSGVRSQGFELELFTRPMRDLQVNGGIVMADTKYRGNLVGANGRALTNALFQLPGRRVSGAPKWTMTGSVAWTPALGSGGLRGLVYFDGRYMSRYNTGSDLDIEKIQRGYTVFNGRVGVHGPGDSWAIELWGQNLFNKNAIQVAFDAPLQGGCTTRGAIAGFCGTTPSGIPNRSTQLFGAFLGEPRTFGVTLRGKMGFSRPAPAPYVAPPAPLPPPVVEQPAPPPPPPPPVQRGQRG
ncbi:MAG TPA: TonB-dependent receptor [Sphingomicrobium sp.]|nr:TonB-dependent receptor [Sphingomicrobium sp.]